ncbi:dihydrofolate reductase family protein [Streptomyces barringtoniae]|uniref:dihydrofolate reductase family protein n=1 Tax=Streptomyces barringtoniae TaxID=2892029 RepID=UPI001E365033|nr:dihydrofolate reductase family protein [Streptomyces barringtoniae]MCC5480844.1 dihydrofolate reductase family protein [Streptomyces barringtoniae]
MRKLTYYVAASLDGYIAGPDGSYDFFPFEGEVREAILAEYPETMPVHLRGPFGLTDTPHRHFDTVIMGRGTYEPALKAGITSPYAHLKQYVVSRTLASTDPEVEIVADAPAELVRDLKKQEGMDIWLAGGGKLAAALRDEIDQLIIKHNPVVIGTGIPLFDGPFTPTGFLPAARRDFGSGLSIVTYTRK